MKPLIFSWLFPRLRARRLVSASAKLGDLFLKTEKVARTA